MNQTNAKLKKEYMGGTQYNSKNETLFVRNAEVLLPDFLSLIWNDSKKSIKGFKELVITDIHVKESLKQKQPTYLIIGDLQFLILPSEVRKTREGDVVFKGLCESFKNIIDSIQNSKSANSSYETLAPFLTNEAKLRLSVNNSAYIQGIINLRNFVTNTEDYQIFTSSIPLYNYEGKMKALEKLYRRDVAELQRKNDVRLVIRPLNVRWYLNNFIHGYYELTTEHGTLLFHEEDIDFSAIEDNLYSYIMNRKSFYKKQIITYYNKLKNTKDSLENAYNEFNDTKDSMENDLSLNDEGGVLDLMSRYHEYKYKF